LISPQTEKELITVTVYATEPECEDDQNHDWQSPYDLLGGNKENPGEFGHDGGVTCSKACGNCGRYKITDTWARRPDTGEKGLCSVEYRDADNKSIAWVKSLRD
jgi:hypothetical protein